uniref:Uncharacterized protein n=1 Tax=Arundo donax TaxID=35708 RepID=A0A0A9E8X1_ARUDO
MARFCRSLCRRQAGIELEAKAASHKPLQQAGFCTNRSCAKGGGCIMKSKFECGSAINK